MSDRVDDFNKPVSFDFMKVAVKIDKFFSLTDTQLPVCIGTTYRSCIVLIG